LTGTLKAIVTGDLLSVVSNHIIFNCPTINDFPNENKISIVCLLLIFSSLLSVNFREEALLVFSLGLFSSYLLFFSSDTESFFLPFTLLLDNTFWPLADFILFLKPCLFFLFLVDGWYVLFIVYAIN